MRKAFAYWWAVLLGLLILAGALLSYRFVVIGSGNRPPSLPIPPKSAEIQEPVGTIPAPSQTPSPQPPETVCLSMQKGLDFLNSRYNPSLGLLNESPLVAPNRYWLTNDNLLAAYTFSQLGQPELSAALLSSLRRYGYEANGQIEVIRGWPVSFPPFVANPVLISRVGTAEIWQEFHSAGERMGDWNEYANLGFLGALDAYQRGNIRESLNIYSATLAQYDGMGFADKAFDGRYETYKLALGLYVGTAIHAPDPVGDQLLRTMQAMQNGEGGFVTHYRDPQTPDGDANTETTAFALLAEKAYGCTPH